MLRKEVQDLRLALPAAPTAGTFTVAFRGIVSSALSHSTTDTQMKAALEAIASVGSVTVTRAAYATHGFAWTIRFDGVDVETQTAVFVQAVGDLPEITVISNSVTHGSADATAVTLAVIGNHASAVAGTSPFSSTIALALVSAAHTTAVDANHPYTNTAGGLSTGTFEHYSSFVVEARDRFTNRVVARSALKEVQTILTAGSTTLTGSFTLSFGSETTAPIQAYASAQEIADALELLNGVGDVAVSGQGGNFGYSRMW